MRTAIDVTLDGESSRAELLTMAGDIRTAVEHSRRTLDGLLALARSRPREQRPTDLAEVAEESLAAVTREDVTLHTDLRPAPASGEPVLLERMAANLVDNAARYNHAGGHITVTTGTDAGQVFLRVTNSGPPIRAEEADELLEPFVRGNGVRTHTDGGAGLGLSIVRAIVAAHHGEVAVVARTAGGLDVTVRLSRLTGARCTVHGAKPAPANRYRASSKPALLNRVARAKVPSTASTAPGVAEHPHMPLVVRSRPTRPTSWVRTPFVRRSR